MPFYLRHPIKPDDLAGNCDRFETVVILFIYLFIFSEGNVSVCVCCNKREEKKNDAALLNLPDGEQFHGQLHT